MDPPTPAPGTPPLPSDTHLLGICDTLQRGDPGLPSTSPQHRQQRGGSLGRGAVRLIWEWDLGLLKVSGSPPGTYLEEKGWPELEAGAGVEREEEPQPLQAIHPGPAPSAPVALAGPRFLAGLRWWCPSPTPGLRPRAVWVAGGTKVRQQVRHVGCGGGAWPSFRGTCGSDPASSGPVPRDAWPWGSVEGTTPEGKGAWRAGPQVRVGPRLVQWGGTVGQRGPGIRRTPPHTGCLWSPSAQHATTPYPGDFYCVHLGSRAGKSVGNH